MVFDSYRALHRGGSWLWKFVLGRLFIGRATRSTRIDWTKPASRSHLQTTASLIFMFWIKVLHSAAIDRSSIFVCCNLACIESHSRMKNILLFLHFGALAQGLFHEGTLRILCFGDSITAGFTNHGTSRHPYAGALKSSLQTSFPDLNIITDNHGLSGDQVQFPEGSYLPRITSICEIHYHGLKIGMRFADMDIQLLMPIMIMP